MSPRAVGSRTRILMHRTAPLFGAGPVDGDPRITVVTVTTADRLNDGRWRYTAHHPRLVQWVEGEAS